MVLAAQLMPKQMLTAMLEAGINKTLALSRNAGELMKPLNGKDVSLFLHELGFTIRVGVQDGGINVMADNPSEQCHIDTSLKVLPKLKQSSLLTSLIKSGQLDITGDPKIAQHFAQAAEHLSIDWEQLLADRIGDVPAFKFSQLVKTARDTFRFKTTQLQQDIGEFLLYEETLCVSAPELSAFAHRVSELSSQAERLEQRLHLLLNQTDKG